MVPTAGAFTDTLKVTVMACPKAGALGEVAVIVVVVEAEFTVCGTAADVLAAKFASPAKAAVKLSAPAALGDSVQLPVARLAVQLTPVLSDTVAVSLAGIVPVPGALTVTVKLTVTDCPTTDGFGVLAVILVLVEGGPTT
jgi:hypothetical protein